MQTYLVKTIYFIIKKLPRTYFQNIFLDSGEPDQRDY